MTTANRPDRFPFAFTRAYRLAALPFGVTPARAAVLVDHDAGSLTARFGLWRLQTSLDNVLVTEVTGPYQLLKTVGPAHLSFTDRGLTMATNPDRGLCIRFREPVPGIEPTGRIRHPGLTVTVADCTGLAAAISRR
jgi:hypothetical protein